MCVYYTVFASFDIKDLDAYCTWRDILGNLNVFFFCAVAVILSLYSDLLKMVLAYQRSVPIQQVAVLID